MAEYQSKQQIRRLNRREKRKIILIGCEGNNKTEKNYFQSFNNAQTKYKIKFSCGNDTDLEHILKNIKQSKKDIGFDSKLDKSFAIFDIDNNINKIKSFENIKNNIKYKDICFIPSNPCFELWYLLHFTYTTKSFNSSDDLIKYLKKYIPDYKKSLNCFDELLPYIDEAIENNEKLIKNIEDDKSINYLKNSYTNVTKIVKILYEELLQSSNEK